MCLSEALKKSCRCLMNESFRQQVSRLSNAGYPKSLVVSVAEGLHRKVLEKRCEAMDRMATSKEKKWLTDEEIQELIFLPDGELSDADFDSDPDDPEHEPRDDKKLIDSCPLEVVINIRDQHPREDDDGGMPSNPVEAVPGTSRHTAAQRRKMKESVRRKWTTKDVMLDDTAWKSYKEVGIDVRWHQRCYGTSSIRVDEDLNGSDISKISDGNRSLIDEGRMVAEVQ
ncbi:hypothetical protein HPB51_027922 [Rhipicephalus microplus]|uniref:Uncharacterized protein n=1 Tax=Rhipicephalus microplus TaxID=6941 RepID=A0A9J6CYX7_RHIMP|nr:hypothetical protein HPB51_027922 [Rhipicephalus microplus]